MFKRRQLNKDSSNQQSQQKEQRPSPAQPKQGEPRQGEGAQGNGRRRRRSRHNQHNQNASRGNRGNGGQGGQRYNQRRQQPVYSAYYQRDVLLILNKADCQAVETVRKKFDPLAVKIPAHVTVLYSEASAKIHNDIFKKIDLGRLPSVKTLTFTSIEIVDEMYLWLMPDKTTEEALRAWHDVFTSALGEGHTQGEKYAPHITLGYIPRKMPEEDALAFASSLITLPLTINTETLLLEEFSEDQNSKSLDRFAITT